VTYTPNPGFVGIDEFIVEFCYTDARCDIVNVVVDVKSGPTDDNEENDSSKGLYALSVLALIPSIVAAVFVRKRYIQNRHRDSETVKKPSDNPADPDLPPTNPPDPMEPSPDPSALHSTTHAVIGQDVTTTAESSDDTASRQSSKGGGVSPSARGKGQCPPGIESHMLSNKDQCRTHAEESREVPVADAVPAEYRNCRKNVAFYIFASARVAFFLHVTFHSCILYFRWGFSIFALLRWIDNKISLYPLDFLLKNLCKFPSLLVIVLDLQ
jgi:hypothetical protein